MPTLPYEFVVSGSKVMNAVELVVVKLEKQVRNSKGGSNQSRIYLLLTGKTRCNKKRHPKSQVVMFGKLRYNVDKML